MNLLQKGLQQRAVIKTTLTRKLTIDGITSAYPVYKVNLDWLFYNDQNDRIATWISQYKSEHNGLAPDMSDKEAYNSIIENFIIESNPEAIKKTKNNIEMVDQREPGVVLADGRIIDGNRRFTCLRLLSRKNERFQYFETVILDRNIESSAKEIKMLELSIQHGEETKVDYNPIDRLVGLYNDVIDTKLLSIEEYAQSTNESINVIKINIETAKLLVEFLEFINAPKQFYIARDLKVSGPIEELVKLIKKCRTEEEIKDLKVCVFNNILMQTEGDMTRFIRNIKNIIGSENQSKFMDEQKELANKVLEKLPEVGQVNSDVIRDIMRNDDEIGQALKNSMEYHLNQVRKVETRYRPIQLVEKATQFLEDIDTNIISKMNKAELKRLEGQISKLEDVLSEIKWNL